MQVALTARRAARVVQTRAFSTLDNIDFAAIRAKMSTEQARANFDKTADTFQKRISSANVPAPQPIDWAYYKSALPDLNIDAIKADFEKVASSTPAVTYDESADLAAHIKKENALTSFSAYCTRRIAELEAMQDEQSKHKLHLWYRRRQIYARFPGLYEELHNKVRGQWDEEIWGRYIAYKAGITPLPWDANVGELDDAKIRELMISISEKAGCSPADLGFVLPEVKA